MHDYHGSSQTRAPALRYAFLAYLTEHQYAMPVTAFKKDLESAWKHIQRTLWVKRAITIFAFLLSFCISILSIVFHLFLMHHSLISFLIPRWSTIPPFPRVHIMLLVASRGKDCNRSRGPLVLVRFIFRFVFHTLSSQSCRDPHGLAFCGVEVYNA